MYGIVSNHYSNMILIYDQAQILFCYLLFYKSLTASPSRRATKTLESPRHVCFPESRVSLSPFLRLHGFWLVLKYSIKTTTWDKKKVYKVKWHILKILQKVHKKWLHSSWGSQWNLWLLLRDSDDIAQHKNIRNKWNHFTSTLWCLCCKPVWLHSNVTVWLTRLCVDVCTIFN